MSTASKSSVLFSARALKVPETGSVVLHRKVQKHVIGAQRKYRPLVTMAKTLYVSRLRDPINTIILVGLPVLVFWVSVALDRTFAFGELSHSQTPSAIVALIAAVIISGTLFGFRSTLSSHRDGSIALIAAMPFNAVIGWALHVILGFMFALTSAVVTVIVATAPVYDLGITGNVPLLVLPVTAGYWLSYQIGYLVAHAMASRGANVKAFAALVAVTFAGFVAMEVLTGYGIQAEISSALSSISPVSHLHSLVQQTVVGNVQWQSFGQSMLYLLVLTVAVMTATRAIWTQRGENMNR